MKHFRIVSIFIVLCLLNLVEANTLDYTNNPYYNHVETDEDGVEWVKDNNRPRTAQIILT